MTNLPKKFIDSIQDNGIDLEGNGITNEDAENLKQLITGMKDYVLAIELSNNELGQDIINVLKEIIPECKKLEYIFMTDTGLSEDQKNDMKQFIETCKTTRITF
jgi:Ran GTPase-activating protein (RanGAP) involved in mRNA processing and transport